MHNYSSLSSGSRYCKPEVISWWKVSITVFYTRFLSPDWSEMCRVIGVLTVLLLLPTQYTAGEIFKMWCQEFNKYLLANIYIDIDITLLISDMDFLYQFNLRLHNFEGFFSNVEKKKIQKLAGLWLVGEVVNHHDHVGLYGSKVAEGCSAFQRRSCVKLVMMNDLIWRLGTNLKSGIAWLCIFSLLVHSDSKRHVHLSNFSLFI